MPMWIDYRRERLLCGWNIAMYDNLVADTFLTRRVKIEIPATGNATKRGGTTIQRRGSAGLEAGTPGVISFYWRFSLMLFEFYIFVLSILCIIVLTGALFSSFPDLLLYWFQMYWSSQFCYSLLSPERQEGAIVRLQADTQTSEDRNPCNRKCHPKRRNHNPKKRLSRSWSRHARGDLYVRFV